jgi:hypothetical protein
MELELKKGLELFFFKFLESKTFIHLVSVFFVFCFVP